MSSTDIMESIDVTASMDFDELVTTEDLISEFPGSFGEYSDEL